MFQRFKNLILPNVPSFCPQFKKIKGIHSSTFYVETKKLKWMQDNNYNVEIQITLKFLKLKLSYSRGKLM